MAGPASNVESLTVEALQHGWTVMFADRHPHAGGAGPFATATLPKMILIVWAFLATLGTRQFFH